MSISPSPARRCAPASPRSSATRRKDWVEAIYVYPLPSGGAVDTLKMVIGDRVIVGDIKERQQASIIYEQAKADGQKAALTEQERPNIFTNSVANIGPGETVLVQIEYQEPVQQSGNEFSLRVPLVVGAALQSRAGRAERRLPARRRRLGRGQIRSRCRTATASRRRCSTPRATRRSIRPRITVRLQAGFPLGEVKSHHHAIKTEKADDSTSIIRLAEGPVPADRDFELTWKPAAEKAPSVGLFREHVGDGDYLLAFVTPPSVEQAQQKPLPREVIFVIDNSGSMGGTSIIQAKASLTLRARPPAADRPLQRDPLRPHHGRAVPRQPCRPTGSMSARPSPLSTRCRPTAAPKWCRRCGPR